MVLVYITLGYIDGIHVAIYIAHMDPMGMDIGLFKDNPDY